MAILVHGGCWSVKLPDVPEPVTSFELLRPIAAALAEAGIGTWNIEYRRLGNSGGGWPGTYQDLGRATDMLRDLALRYHLDLSRAIAIGHSSGGQLALWLAARKNVPKDSVLHTDSPLPLRGVIDIDGPPDLRVVPFHGTIGMRIAARHEFHWRHSARTAEPLSEGSATGLLPLGVKQESVHQQEILDVQWKRLMDPTSWWLAEGGRFGSAADAEGPQATSTRSIRNLRVGNP